MRSALLPGFELHQSLYSKSISNAVEVGKGVDPVSLSLVHPSSPSLPLVLGHSLSTSECSLQPASLLFTHIEENSPKTSGRNLFNIYQPLQQLK